MVISRKKMQSIYLVFSIILLLWANNGVFSYVNLYIPAVFKYGLFGICIVLATILDKKYLDKLFKNIFPLLIFLFIMYLSHFLFKTHNLFIYYKPIIYLIIIYSQYLYYQDADSTTQKYIIYILLIDYLFLSLNTIKQLNDNPYLSRILATADAEYVSNVGGYSFIYSTITFILYFLNNLTKKRRIILSSILILLFLYTLYKGSFTISYIILILSIVLFVVLKLYNKKKILTIFLLISVIIFSFSYVTPNILKYVANHNGANYEIRMRANEMLNFYSGKNIDGTDINSRFIRYKMSLESFNENILYGNFGSKPVGGHSSWLDLLGLFGLLSLSFFVFQFKFFKCVCKKIRKDDIPLYISILFSYILQGLINTVLFFNTFLYMFLLVPLLLTNNEEDI